jgi:hypothetical protein
MSKDFCQCSNVVQKNWGKQINESGQEVCSFCERLKIDQELNSNNPKAGLEKNLSVTEHKLGKNTSHWNSKEIGLLDVIESQNRTTHAVRAFVRFLFIQLSATTLAIFLWNLSNIVVDTSECVYNSENCGGNGFLQFVAIATLLVGIVWSSNAGWSGLSKSEIRAD